MKFFAHLNTAVQVLELYQGQQPFGHFIKEFFRKDKKYGSRDRKSISHLCYCYFRLGKSLKALPAAERIVAGLFLCSVEPNDMLGQLKPAWNAQAGLQPEVKWKRVVEETGLGDQLEEIFPWHTSLSEGLDLVAFNTSFLVQPDLFVRCRPGKLAAVKQQLHQAGLHYKAMDDCIALPNGSKIEEVITLNKEAVVQDYSSQRVGEFLNRVKLAWEGIDGKGAGEVADKGARALADAPGGEKHQRRAGMKAQGITTIQRPVVWDCCAASGGKSILAWDVLGRFDLTVSDIRESIIANLRQRFAEAGVAPYRSLVADLSDPRTVLPVELTPSLIIADVPCSGSGTWSRTPEQLFYFEAKEIARYQALQQKIVGRVQERLTPGGFFLYITCSVFKAENEMVVAYLQEHFGLEPVHMELLKGYDLKADTMFAALLRKP